MDAAPPPRFTFKTRTNTALGAASVELDDDGSVVLRDVVKKVTESMLTSYPRTLLGHWTPNRAALRYPAEEVAERRITRVDGDEILGLDEIRALSG